MQVIKKIGKVTTLELSTSSAKEKRIVERELATQLPPEILEASGIVINTAPGTATVSGYCPYVDNRDRLLIKGSSSDWIDVPLTKRENFSVTLETEGEIKVVLGDTETNTGTTRVQIESVEVKEKEGNYPLNIPLVPIDLIGSVSLENNNLILSTGGGDSDDSKFKKWLPLPIPPLMTEGSGALFSVIPGDYQIDCFILTRESNVERDSLLVCTDKHEVIEICERRQATIQETKTRYASGSISETFSTNGKFSIIGADTGSKSGSTYFHVTGLKRLSSKPLVWEFGKDPEDKDLEIYLDSPLEVSITQSTPGLLILHIEYDGTINDNSQIVLNGTSCGRETLILSYSTYFKVSLKSKVGKVRVNASFREMADLETKLANGELNSILEENDFSPEWANYVVLSEDV